MYLFLQTATNSTKKLTHSKKLWNFDLNINFKILTYLMHFCNFI
jgi:hypothetical protein